MNSFERNHDDGDVSVDGLQKPTQASVAWWLAVILLLGSAGQSLAHLSIIRQGDESRGAQEAGDEYGKSVTMGDFNGDGFMDVATGTPGEAIGSNSDAGCVIVSFGSALGITHVGAQLLTQGSFSGDPDQTGAQFGYSVKAGDFNNDGYDDLAIGGPYWDGGSILNCGRIWYAQGSSSGLSAVYDLGQEGAGGSSEADDYFGFSLAVGDFDADGYADLAVGGPGEDDDAGAVFQFLGSAFGPIENGGWFKQSTLGGVNERGDRFGFSLAAGNVIVTVGTSYDDLAVGSPNENGSQVTSGEVWLIRGTSSGLSSSSPFRYDADSFDSEQAGAAFGWSLATGRFFGGSTVGLAIGEPLRDILGKANAGRVIVARGAGTGLQMASAIQVRQDASGETVEADDRFGYTLGSGDLGTVNSGQELFVGAPDEKVGTTTEGGYASVFFGGSNGPTGEYGWYGFYQTNLGDAIDPLARLGSSFASGITDDSGKASLAIGAPGDNGRRGMVHVVAPWRQVLGLGGKTSAVYDCQGDLVFSQKPFEEVCIASTTKTLTVLIACERSQLPIGHPKRISLNSEYNVPNWVIDNVAGSRFEFKRQERIRLEDLLYACMYPSGNDAAYAIADFLTGSDGVWVDHLNVVPDFIDEMNDRAQALGMTRSYFSNPAGLDLDGTHHSTAEDMLKLSRAAMANPLFRQVTSDLTHSFTRRWESPSGSSEFFTQNYGWLNGFRNYAPDAIGVKPGETPCGNKTACFAVPAPGHDEPAVASSFHNTQGSAKVKEDGAALIALGLAECGFPTLFEWNGNTFHSWMPDVSTYIGDRTGGAFAMDEDMPELQLELFRTGGVNPTSARLEILHSMEAYFDPAEQLGFGLYDEFEEHTGLEIQNVGDATVRLRISLPYQTAYTIDLEAEGKHVIPPHEEPYPEGFHWWIENQTGATHGVPAYLHVKEGFAWDLSSIGAGSGPHFSTGIKRMTDSDNLNMTVIGTDPTPGSRLYLALHENGVPAGVDGLPTEPGEDMARVANVVLSPSPFTDRTTLRFALPLGGDVEVGFFDAQGREVRRISQSGLVAGSWSVHWDGQTGEGVAAPAGIYFYKLMVDGRSEADGKLVRIR